MVFETIAGLGIALLLAPALAEYAKIRTKAAKGFNWMAAGGALMLLAAVFAIDISALGLTAETLSWGTAIFGAIGLIVTLIGALFVTKDLLMSR